MKTKRQMATEIVELAMYGNKKETAINRIARMRLDRLTERYNEIIEKGASTMAAYFAYCVTGICPAWFANLKK